MTPKRQEWVIRAPRGDSQHYYVSHFERGYGGASGRFNGFTLKHQGHSEAAYWLRDALRFRTRKEASAFLQLLRPYSTVGWRLARVDTYRVVKKIRRRRAEPAANGDKET